MYSLVSLETVESRDLETTAPTLRSVGDDLQPENMRPAIWEFDAGDENVFHRQSEQEELYVVLKGRLDATIERGDDRDVLEIKQNDFLVVPPESWRQLEARENSTVLVVGAPNVPDDGILES